MKQKASEHNHCTRTITVSIYKSVLFFHTYCFHFNFHDSGKSVEKNIVLSAVNTTIQKYAGSGFEIYLCDLHQDTTFVDSSCWMNNPKEAYGGHELANNCLASISSKYYD